MKALVAAVGDRILGFAMIGAEAGIVMAMVVSGPAAGNSTNRPKPIPTMSFPWAFSVTRIPLPVRSIYFSVRPRRELDM
jgi:hypothetical protein